MSLLEVVVAFGMQRLALSRLTASILTGIAAFVAGVPAALGSGVLREIELHGHDILGIMDYVTGNVLLPLGGIAVVLFVGWFVPRAAAIEASGLRSRSLGWLWLADIRFVAPVAIAIVFVALVAAR